MLQNVGASHAPVNPLEFACLEAYKTPLFQQARCFVDHPGGPHKLAYVSAMPWTASNSTQHGIKTPAPHLGEHTKSFLKKGWSEIAPEAAIKKALPGTTPQSRTAPLAGVTVIEVSRSSSVTGSAATVQMADMGATVIKIEPLSGDPWRTRDARFYEQLNRGKKSERLDITTTAGLQALREKLEQADLFVCDLPTIPQELAFKTLPKRLVVLHITGCRGSTEAAGVHGDLGAWYALSGFAQAMGGKPPGTPPVLPTQFGGLNCSFHALAAAMAGVFHQKRTGEGQLVEINLLACGTWSMIQSFAMATRDPEKLELVQKDPDKMREESPVPTVGSFRTKDGLWLQLLGVDPKRHIPIILKALGIRAAVYSKIVYAILFKVIPSKEKTTIKKLLPVFAILNNAIEAAIGALTYAEIRTLFAQHDVWYCRINMPKDALGDAQARACGTFLGDPMSEQCQIATPVQLS